MAVKIVPKIPGWFAKSFNTNNLATDYVDIVYSKRSRLGKLLKVKKTKRINLPKGTKILKIENNYPKVGNVAIKYK